MSQVIHGVSCINTGERWWFALKYGPVLGDNCLVKVILSSDNI